MFNDTDAFFSSRPVIKVNGETRADLNNNLLSVMLTESVTDMARLQARFLNWEVTNDGSGFLFFDGNALAFGDQLNVTFGGERGTAELFEGRITALEGVYPRNSPPEIQVYAEDSLEALRHIRRSRTFSHVSDVEVIETIASEYGLQTEFNLLTTIPIQDVISQLDQTDLAFLLGRARRLGLALWIEGNTLHVQERSQAESSPDLTLGDKLLSFRVRADLSEQVTELGVTGWSVEEKEALDAIADDSQLPFDVFGSASGSALIDLAYGDRVERLVRQVPLDIDEARALAEAQFLARAYRFVLGEGEAVGMPELRAGKTVSLGGLGPWYEGTYYVTEVRHSFDGDIGYRTTFKLERPALNEISGSAFGRQRRRLKVPQPGRGKIPSRGGKKPLRGKKAKPSPIKEREPKPKKPKDPDLTETMLHTAVDDRPEFPAKLDDPAVTRPSKSSRGEGV